VKEIHINDALEDPELMLAMQMADVSGRLESRTDVLGIRANYGTGILTSMFGAEIYKMPREMKTLPTTRSFNSREKMEEILAAGIPDRFTGFGKDVFYFGEMCADLFQQYPNISKYVPVFHPDTQGPLDIAELMWGSEMFYDMYDDPEFVHEVLELITETYIHVMDKWYEIIPADETFNVHWKMLHRGKIMLRNDSAMNLSPDMYQEFALPYDKRLLDYYGGGCVHFCGRGDHYIEHLTSVESLTAINLSQPHLNDMDKIYAAAARGGKKIIGLNREAGEAYAKRPDAVKGMIY